MLGQHAALLILWTHVSFNSIYISVEWLTLMFSRVHARTQYFTSIKKKSHLFRKCKEGKGELPLCSPVKYNIVSRPRE